MTADAYFNVHQHRGMYAGALYCVERGRDLVERIAQLEQRAGPRSSKSIGPGTCSPTSSSKPPPRVKRGGSTAPPHPGPPA